MVAMQIAAEPLVRQSLRQAFQGRAVLCVKPTRKGRKVCSLAVLSMCESAVFAGSWCAVSSALCVWLHDTVLWSLWMGVVWAELM